jgi:uncharacterized protein (DUF362 family)
MRRRSFLQLAAAAATTARSAPTDGPPSYRVVTPFPPSPKPGMPGPFPGKVVRVRAEKSIETATEKVDVSTVREMMSRGMRSLTGAKNDRDAWAPFFNAKDVVGIKLNCSGAPHVRTSPEVVGAIVEQLTALDIPAGNIYLYERFPDQLKTIPYARYVPAGVNIVAIEMSRGAIVGYDPKTYVEVDFFGEDDTRSNMIRLVTERFTKIINVPNVKDHQAAGITGCLKNIAYGDYSNVARSHQHAKTNTLTFIGTLANVEPLRSRTVLQVMDGLYGVWHGGPFATIPKFRFYPKEILFGTDPVAMDRVLIDIIENKRMAEAAISIWDRSMSKVARGHNDDPNVNHYIREPGHVEFAGKLGLGVYDMAKIRVTSLEV